MAEEKRLVGPTETTGNTQIATGAPLSALGGAVWPDKSGAMLLPLVASSMSAFGGKADVNHCVAECPLLAISGHSGDDGVSHLMHHKRTYLTRPASVRKP